MKLIATCPCCGSGSWRKGENGTFVCDKCGYDCYPEEMGLSEETEGDEKSAEEL